MLSEEEEEDDVVDYEVVTGVIALGVRNNLGHSHLIP